MDLKAKRAELEKARAQALANLNYIAGQLALLDELEAPAPPAEPVVE